MVKLGDTNPARLLVKRRLQKLDAEALEAEHTHICGGSDMDHMTRAQRLQLILDKLETKAPTGRMGEAGTNRTESVIGTRRV